MDLINILTLYKSLFITYINSNTYIFIDKCLLVSGYTLTTSSENATVGLDFTFTCVTTNTLIVFTRDITTVCTITITFKCVTGKTVTTETYVLFSRDGTTVCFITDSNTDGTCALDGSYITDYTYTCNTTTNTYTLAIPGSYLTESLHGTIWRCENPFGGGRSSTKILNVNGELFFLFFLYL